RCWWEGIGVGCGMRCAPEAGAGEAATDFVESQGAFEGRYRDCLMAVLPRTGELGSQPGRSAHLALFPCQVAAGSRDQHALGVYSYPRLRGPRSTETVSTVMESSLLASRVMNERRHSELGI